MTKYPGRFSFMEVLFGGEGEGGRRLCPDTIRRLITQNIVTAVLMCILNEIQTARKVKVQIFAIMQNIGTTVLLYELNEMKAALETKAQVFAI